MRQYRILWTASFLGLLLTGTACTGKQDASDGNSGTASSGKATSPGPVDEDAPEEFTETESGLKYRILRESDGPKPSARDTVVAHYRGTLDDGTVFDSSYERGEPATFPLQAVIPGWREGLQLVGKGGMIELEIPPELAYGPNSPPGSGIPSNATLHFTVELLDVKAAPSPVEPGPVDEDAPEEFTETESGLRYRILRKSDGPKPTPQDTVVAHYRGTLEDGTVFDSSYQRGEPATFPLQGVIPGWREGLQQVGKGGMIELEIPPELAYGANSPPGSGIPPNSTLQFTVELIDIK